MARKDLLYSFLQTLMFLVFTNADPHETCLNNCVKFHLARVQEYDPTLETTRHRQNYSTHPEDASQSLSLFGTLPSDWNRLSLLRDALPEDSTIRKNFNHLFTILFVAHEQASKINRSSPSQENVNDFPRGKMVSSVNEDEVNTTKPKKFEAFSNFHEIESTTVQSTLQTRSDFENTPIMTETFYPAPKINNSFVNSQNLISSSEEARKILGLTSFNSVTKTPSTEKKKFEESATPEHLLSPKEKLLKSPQIRNESLCNNQRKAENFVNTLTSNQSASIPKEKIDELDLMENQNNSLQPSTSINVQTSTPIPRQNIPGGTVAVETVPRKQENDKQVKTQFFEEYSLPSTFANDPRTLNKFSTITRSSEVSGSTKQQLGTSSSTELSTEVEEYLLTKILSTTSTKPISTTSPSDELSTDEDEVEKYSWAQNSSTEQYSYEIKTRNDLTTEFESSMTTPTALIPTSGRELIQNIFHTQDSKLEDRIPTETTVIDLTSNVDPPSIESPKEEQFPTTKDESKKSKNTDISSNVKIDWNHLNEALSNLKTTESTLEAYSRYLDDCRSKTQEPTSVSITEQTKSSVDSWTTTFPSERASVIIETDNKNDEMKTTNYRDQMEIFQSEKSISNKSDFLTETSDIYDTTENNFENIESTNYWNRIKVPEDVPLDLSIPNEAETANSNNNSTDFHKSPQIKTSVEKSEAVSSQLQSANTTASENNKSNNRLYTIDVNKEMKVTVTGTVSTETPSHSILQKTSIPFPKQHFVKNALSPSLTRNNQISRDYKHVFNDSKADRNNSDYLQSNVYEYGVSAKNRSFWRQQLDKQFLTTNNLRRLETIKDHFKPINMEHYEKSSYNTESNVPITEQPNDLPKWSTHGRVNKLRPRKRDSKNRDIEQQFRWFYRQGQTEDRIKSRLKENNYTKIRVRCKNPQH